MANLAARGLVESSLEGGILTLRLNRPEKLNALNADLLKALALAARKARADRKVLGVVIEGKGRAFSAGADLREMKGLDEKKALAFSKLGQEALSEIECVGKPTVAVVRGLAAGGGNELALACDFIFASPEARFWQPEKRFGLITGFGGLYRLTHLLGSDAARAFLNAPEPITAEQAHRIGLVDEVHPGESLEAEALRFLSHVVKHDSLARPSRKHHSKEEEKASQKAFELEREAFAALFKTGAPQKRIEAFLKK